MSAFVVSRETIDVLVHAAQYGWHRGPGSSGRGLSWFDVDAVTLRAMSNNEVHEHYRTLVGYGPTGVLDRTVNDLGALLWAENVRSVNYRYSEDEIEWVYEHRALAGLAVSPVEVLRACDCYEYQSCEHPEWPSSEACQILDAIRAKATRALPGYDEAPGDWTPSDLATHRGVRLPPAPAELDLDQP